MGKYLWLVILFFLLGQATLYSKEKTPFIIVDNEIVFISNESVKIEYVKSSNRKDSILIPLKRAGNLFLIEARIDTMVGNFIVYLGAPYLVLNATYFRDYEIDYGRGYIRDHRSSEDIAAW